MTHFLDSRTHLLWCLTPSPETVINRYAVIGDPMSDKWLLGTHYLIHCEGSNFWYSSMCERWWYIQGWKYSRYSDFLATPSLCCLNTNVENVSPVMAEEAVISVYRRTIQCSRLCRLYKNTSFSIVDYEKHTHVQSMCYLIIKLIRECKPLKNASWRDNYLDR